MQLTTALVVSGGGFQGLALLRCLRALPGVRVLAADCHAENVGRYLAHGFHTAPLLADGPAFAGFLQQLCRNEAVQHVLPSTSLELPALSALVEPLAAQGTCVWVCAPAVLALARSKRRFYAWAEALGLPVLPVFGDPLQAGPRALIGKPDDGYGGRGIVRSDGPIDLQALPAEELTSRVWQPQLQSFDEYSVDCAVDAQGRPSPLWCRRRVRESGGFAVLCEPGAPVAVQAAAQAAVAALAAAGARGVLNLQLLDDGGEVWLSDFNARSGTSLPLSLAAGGNPLAWLLGLGMGPGPADAVPVAPLPRRTLRLLHEHAVPALDLAGVRGVVFDLDDTLLDQKDWILRKLRLTWQSLQAELPPEREFLRTLLEIIEEGERQRPFDLFVQRLSLPQALLGRLIDTYRQARPAQARLYTDVAATLAQLRRDGYRLALLTDNPAASQQMKIEVAGLAASFDALVLSAELGTAKPDPLTFETAAQRLGLPPDQLVMVGDHLYRDLVGALDSGYRHAFRVRRDGGFFNFSEEVAAGLVPARHISTLDGLGPLHWHLTETKA